MNVFLVSTRIPLRGTHLITCEGEWRAAPRVQILPDM